MGVVSMKQLLEAGVHFGHQTRRWNPKMARYIFTERNGIYIIDLQKTVKKLEEAYMFVRDVAANGDNVLFVGTKKQAGESIKEEAERAGAHYVNARWLGGMMTNFKTIRRRIQRLEQLRKMQEDGTFDRLPKKEVGKLELEINRRRKLTALSTAPASTPTRISFHRTANRSRKCTSPVAIARITMVLLCEPALPPVSVSIGIKVTSIGTAAKALSYFARMLPVIMPDTISAISQKILFFAKVKAPVCR